MRTSTTRWLAPLAVLALLGLGGCGGSDKPADAPSTSEAATQTQADPAASDPGVAPAADINLVVSGKFTVCTNPPYAPFEDVVNGQVVGFDLDLMGEVAKDLGVELSPRQTPFESIESAASLDVDDCDAGASGLTITEDRQAKLDFSEPYYETTMGLLVKEDSGITQLSDLTGKQVGVQQGTTGEDWARSQPELDQIRQFESLGDQVTALKADEVSGIFNDEPTLTPYKNQGLTVVGDFATGEKFGFAVKKGNAALLNQINSTLERVHNDGTYDALVAKWFTQS